MTRSQMRFLLGLCLQVALVGGLSLCAYLDALPRWDWLTRYDYLLHAFLVGPLALWLDGALGYRTLWRAPPVALPLAAVMVAAVAVTEEYLQRLSVYRTSSWLDLAGNLAGIALFTAVSRWHRRASAGHGA